MRRNQHKMLRTFDHVINRDTVDSVVDNPKCLFYIKLKIVARYFVILALISSMMKPDKLQCNNQHTAPLRQLGEEKEDLED